MMKTFDIGTKIVFGQSAMEALDEIQNESVFIVTDNYLASSGMLEKVTAHLQSCTVTVFDQVIPDPPIEIISAGVEALRACRANVIVALGGGSSMDAAKAIRAVVADLHQFDDNTIAFYAIPTTSGSGSEVTSAAVITHRSEGVKYPLLGPELLPDVAILDPNLVLSVPPHVTAYTGMDVLSHAIEAYVARDANDFTDALAEKAVTLVFEYLPKAYVNGADAEARERMHNASCMAGAAFNAAGLGLVHGMAHTLGGRYHVPHGRLNAILLPSVISFNAGIDGSAKCPEAEAAAKKYARLAALIGAPASNPRMGANNLIRAIQQLNRKLDIPSTLKGAGVDRKVVLEEKDEIVTLARNDDCAAWNPRNISEKDAMRILMSIVG